MKIFGIDCSASSVSVAISENEHLISKRTQNNGLMHSQTLMPMIISLLDECNLSVNQIELFGINVGPGSFTGLRIGIAAVKGMAFTNKIPCVGLSTLETMAFHLNEKSGIICPVIDARCNQVYTALFDMQDGKINRILPDDTLMIENLEQILSRYERDIFLIGDAAFVCYNSLKEKNPNLKETGESFNCDAQFVCTLACKYYIEGKSVSADELLPLYLKRPQAERERLLREGKEEKV